MGIFRRTYTGMRGAERFVNDIQKAVTLAVINTVNRQAFTARTQAQENFQKTLITRNKFAVSQIVVTQCKKNVTKINKIQSSVHSTKKAPFLKRQELGGWKQNDDSSPLVIYTDAARTGKSKQKIVAKANRYKKLSEKQIRGNMSKRGTRKSNFIAQHAMAKKLNAPIRIGDKIWKVTQFRKSKKGVSFKRKLLADLSYKKTYTPAKPWLRPAMENVARIGQVTFNDELNKIK